MNFSIENIAFELNENEYGIQLIIGGKPFPLPGQTISNTIEILKTNFECVKQKFTSIASNIILETELNEVCLNIVVHFFYLYNSWKYSNEKEKDRDLHFVLADLHHPDTYDILIHYFKGKYPIDYAGRCAILAEKTVEEFVAYEYNRQQFYNAFR